MAKFVSASYDALVDLFECIENFLRRLKIYSDIPSTPAMAEILVKIMAELLAVLALATKQINRGRFSEFSNPMTRRVPRTTTLSSPPHRAICKETTGGK